MATDRSETTTDSMAIAGIKIDGSENQSESESRTMFRPVDRKNAPPHIKLPDPLWMTILESSCTFPPDIFHGVMLNLIKNPNITSSHLFRADIFYDSELDRTLSYSRGGMRESSFINHLRADYQPLVYHLPGYDLVRTIVRQLIPRNPQLDRPLVQTCHFFSKLEHDGEENVVIYIPHVQEVEKIPFYHPAVRRLAFLHRWRRTDQSNLQGLRTGSVSISYYLFPQTTLSAKLERTTLRLLQTVHKHGQGQLAGYEKRVHLDQIVPQSRYQNTYARLKAKYARHMSEQWVEVTDPGKHVFEDLGIAAFLIEIWRDRYDTPGEVRQSSEIDGNNDVQKTKTCFPGFVDIGCGNGVLVYILAMEGYEGWGFDARERKTWRIFPNYIQQRLHKLLLVPELLQSDVSGKIDPTWHNGIFSLGTFIISNHADELTVWTPLLAYLNQSAFIAVPCCSHDLAGARFRAPPSTKSSKDMLARLPQQAGLDTSSDSNFKTEAKNAQVAETGSLKRTEAQKKVPSAYSTLCSYVASLADEVGYKPEKEVLRIPSTRNHCIIGRSRSEDLDTTSLLDTLELRQQKVSDIVERELRTSVQTAGAHWIQRVQSLAKKPASGH